MAVTYLDKGKTREWDAVTFILRQEARGLGLVVLPDGEGGYRLFERGGDYSRRFDRAGSLRKHLERLGRVVVV